MDLSTTYLGLKLAHPLMPGASPLVDDLDMVRRLEDSGAAAIVMHSLFEEQVTREQLAAHRHMDGPAGTFAEALSYFPESNVFALGPDRYLEQLRKIRAAVSVPVIASLNGTTVGGWLAYGQRMEEAGASAIELNVYELATHPDEPGESVEARAIKIVRIMKASIGIPVAVKLSPFYSSLPHFVRKLEEAGADGVVLFNRLYQPDLDVEALEVRRTLHLSDPSELLLRTNWLAILSGSAKLSLGCSGGVHGPLEAVKAVMAGAHGVQLVSALLRHGPEHLRKVLDGLRTFLVEHEYESLSQLRGSMGLDRCPDPAAYERGNYVHLLQSWHGGDSGTK